jgi:hypothetical protein
MDPDKTAIAAPPSVTAMVIRNMISPTFMMSFSFFQIP